jgi:hypothetical protein
MILYDEKRFQTKTVNFLTTKVTKQYMLPEKVKIRQNSEMPVQNANCL